MAALTEKIMLKPAEVSELYGIGKTKLFAAIKENRLPAVKNGTATLIRRADIEAFVENLPKRVG